MNNKVLNYLSDKKEKLDSLTEEKISQVKEYLQKNSKQIKRTATGLALAGLTTASAVGMAGCDAHDIEVILGLDTYYPIATIRPIEEIEQTSITPEDVLAQLDSISMKALKFFLKNDLHKYNQDLLSTQFTSITVDQNIFSVFNSDGTPADYADYADEPFYYKKRPYYEYSTTFYYNGAYKNEPKDFKVRHFIMSKEDFENIMSAFEREPIELTEELIKPYGANGDSYYGYMIGEYVYEPFEINREVIQNANEEQLWAIYQAATNSMLKLNEKNFYDPEIQDNETE